MIFGFFGKNKEEEEPDEPVPDPVRFLGALNGCDANLKANARLVDAGLVPAKDLISDALNRRADTIRLEPKGAQAVATIMIDGMPFPAGRFAKQDGVAITQMVKLLAGLDIKQRKVAQSGGIKAEFNSKAHELGVNSVPVADGERLTIRVTDLTVKRETTADLGMSDEMKKKIREICSGKGVFLAVGPPGSGTTTTCYAVLRGLDAYTSSIYTVADIGSRKLVNITPFVANPGDPLETTLARCVRVEATVIFVDPLKNADIAKAVFSKHEDVMLLSELVAKDTAAGILQLVEWLGDAEVVSKGLKGMVTQKLIRLLCEGCKQAYRPKPDFLRKVGLPDGVTMLYRKPQESADPNEEICDKCNGVGYYGRVAMFELIEMTEGLRGIVARKGDAAAMKSQFRADKMTTLQQDGLRLVAEGRTSLEELQRVFKAPGT